MFSNDRSVRSIRDSSPDRCVDGYGSVQMSTRRGRTSVPNHRTKRCEIAERLAFQLRGEISLINSSLFELLTVSLFGSAFVKFTTLQAKGVSSSEQEIYDAYFIHSHA